MSQTQINDIYNRLNSLSEEMAAVRATGKVMVWIVGITLSSTGAIALAIFNWWLNKH